MSDIDLFGIRLQLFVGPTLPKPAPYEVIDALTSVEVTNRDQERDGFQMAFSLDKDSPSDYSLLANGTLDPPNRVIIMVLTGTAKQVLIDGIITQHQVVPSVDPGESMLYVTGEDISLQLDLEEKNDTYPNQSDSAIVTKILNTYATYGLKPSVTTTTDIPADTQRIPTQQGTDLAYIRLLAQRNGFVFYIEPTVPGSSTAYWGADNRQGAAQPALTMSVGVDANIESLSMSFNSLGPVLPRVTIVDPATRQATLVNVPSSSQPALASNPAPALRKTLSRDTANLSEAQAKLRAFSSVKGASDAVTVSGELDVVRYGQALQARKPVGVRGTGGTYDGNYYVRQVTHHIKIGEYSQSFTLVREGRGTTVSSVVP